MNKLLPNKAEAFRLEKQMRGKLYTSLAHLFAAAEELVDAETYQTLIKKLKRETEKNNVSAFLYAFNTRLISAVEAQNITTVKMLLISFLKHSFAINAQKITPLYSYFENSFFKNCINYLFLFFRLYKL